MPSLAVKGYLCVIGASILWASSGVVGKALFADGITPSQLVQIRVTVSTVLLALFLGLVGRDRLIIRRADIPYFFVLGGIAMSMVQITYFYAISKIHVAAAIFLQYLAPVMVALFSIWFWKERLTLIKALALTSSLFGCYLVVGGYSFQLLKMSWAGIASGVISAVFFAIYTLYGERGMRRYSPWTVIFYAFLFATLSWHILYPPFHYIWAGHTAQQWMRMLYVSVLGTVIPFALFFAGVNYIRSTRASITATLEPVSAGFLAYLFLGEHLSLLQVAGGGLVVGAIVLLQISRERDEESPAMVRARTAKGL